MTGITYVAPNCPARAQASGLLEGAPARLAEQFGGLLLGDVLVGVIERPKPREIAARARDAAAAADQNG